MVFSEGMENSNKLIVSDVNQNFLDKHRSRRCVRSWKQKISVIKNLLSRRRTNLSIQLNGLCKRVETYPEFNGEQKQEWLTLQNRLEFYEFVP